jgi:hypothetical protein
VQQIVAIAFVGSDKSEYLEGSGAGGGDGFGLGLVFGQRSFHCNFHRIPAFRMKPDRIPARFSVLATIKLSRR